MAPELPASGRRRFTLESAAFSYAGVAFTIIQGILLVPMYLRHMPQELYGAWLASGALLAWVELADPGLASILQQRVAFQVGKEGPAGVGPLIGTGLAAAALISMAPAFAWPLPGPVAGWLGVPAAHVPDLVLAFRIGLGAVALSTFQGALVAVSLGLQEVRSVGIVSLLSIGVGVTVTVGGLLLGIGLASIPCGALARSVVGAVGAVVVLLLLLRRRGIRAGISLAEGRGMLGEALFTFTSRVGVALLSRLDALMSAKLLSPSATVVLTLTGRVVDIVRLGADRLAAAAMPALANFAGERGAAAATRMQRLIGGYTALALGVLGGAAIAWNGLFMDLWVGESRFGGMTLTLALVVQGCLASYVSSIAQAVFALGGIRETAAIALVEAAARLALQLLLVGTMGLVGFPVAAAGALVIVSVPFLLAVAARRFGGTVESHARSLFRALLSMAVLLGAGWLVGRVVPRCSSWTALAAGGAVTIATLFGLALLVFPAVRRDLGSAWMAWRAS